MSIKAEHSPSSSPVNIPFNAGRRSSLYDESHFISTSASSTTSSEAFPQHPHAELASTKHSPSPTSQLPAFASYPPASEQPGSQGHEHHRGPFTMPPYYPTLPSIDMPSGNQTTLPRLDASMPYPARLSSIHSPPSPAPHISSAAYDRERQRERGYDPIVLPPTPLAADGRAAGHGKY